MADLQIEGKIIEIFEKQQVSASFAKREFVVETEDQYPQMVKFELVQNKCDDIDAHNKGDQVSVHFNVRGRKWTNKQGEDVYFVSLNAYVLSQRVLNHKRMCHLLRMQMYLHLMICQMMKCHFKSS